MNDRQKTVLGIVLMKVCSANTAEPTWEQKALLAEALGKPVGSIGSSLGPEDKVKLLTDAISGEGLFSLKTP